ncbi:MAG: DUF4446 family protein [Candidatus Doudnabacteria bacterium]|nr:DUF4446 family protein [Candidatus Doudnabacteria bacterium]MCA9387452.1 DUF4446 family protein [Candidatus Andersenbacteria bacterium]
MLTFLTEQAGIFVLLLGALVVGLGVWVYLLQRKLEGRESHHDQVIRAVEEEGIEGVLTSQARDIKRLTHDATELYGVAESMNARVASALSRISVLRFNPFNDAGGNQSFTCALLDEYGSGLVISSLHHRSSNRMYAKPIVNGQSEFPLSQEEQQAIQEAMMSVRPTSVPQEDVQQEHVQESVN